MFTIWTDLSERFCCDDFFCCCVFCLCSCCFAASLFFIFALYIRYVFWCLDRSTIVLLGFILKRTYHNKNIPVHSNRNRMRTQETQTKKQKRRIEKERKASSHSLHQLTHTHRHRHLLISGQIAVEYWSVSFFPKTKTFSYFAYLAIIVASVIYLSSFTQIIATKSAHFCWFFELCSLNFSNDVFLFLCFSLHFIRFLNQKNAFSVNRITRWRN